MPELAPEAVQDPVGVGPVVAVAQVVATQLFPELAAALVQEPVAVGPVVVVAQVVTR